MCRRGGMAMTIGSKFGRCYNCFDRLPVTRVGSHNAGRSPSEDRVASVCYGEVRPHTAQVRSTRPGQGRRRSSSGESCSVLRGSSVAPC